jgi:hypothetical protein
MIDYEANEEVIKRVREIDDKLHEGKVTGKEKTRLMFEQLLRGLYINQFNI